MHHICIGLNNPLSLWPHQTLCTKTLKDTDRHVHSHVHCLLCLYYTRFDHFSSSTFMASLASLFVRITSWTLEVASSLRVIWRRYPYPSQQKITDINGAFEGLGRCNSQDRRHPENPLCILYKRLPHAEDQKSHHALRQVKFWCKVKREKLKQYHHYFSTLKTYGYDVDRLYALLQELRDHYNEVRCLFMVHLL